MDSKNTTITLYMHAGSGNHGCEAIVSSLLHGMAQQNPRVLLLTNCAAEDEQYLPKDECDLRICEENHMDRNLFIHTAYYLYRKVTKDEESFLRYRYRAALKEADHRKSRAGQNSLAVSIGGDNYCYPIMVQDLARANAMFNHQGIPTVLIGCSIEPGLLKSETEGGLPDTERGGLSAPALLEDLGRYQFILARESITYNALLAAGLPADKVCLVPDPAFTLPAEKPILPEGFLPGRTIGLNLSPMVEGLEKESGIARESFRQLIRHILETTDDPVCLIPHVVWARNDDRIPLRQLYEEFKDTGRVLWAEDRSARQLKGLIAQCRLFIGARTHATIAAYSSGVPTLVLGYSVKARGIAKDLFELTDPAEETERAAENHELRHYVLPVQELNSPQELISAYDWLDEHEHELREKLRERLPQYIDAAKQNAERIRKAAIG